jgi:hypothetical protein
MGPAGVFGYIIQREGIELPPYSYGRIRMHISQRSQLTSGWMMFLLLTVGCSGGTAELAATQATSVKTAITQSLTATFPPTEISPTVIHEIFSPSTIHLLLATPLETPPATLTVCASDCDFTTLQSAIDDPGTRPGAIIEIRDAIHTEAGVVVTKDVIIRGLGPDKTLVQAHTNMEAATDRVFLIAEDVTATLAGMVIQHGNPRPDEYFRCGGGIANLGTLRVDNCVVRNNTANNGGGIWSRNGTLTVINSTIHHNTADRIAVEEDYLNPANLSTYACGSGGGIKLVSGGTLQLINSTIRDNEAKSHGGGVFVACNTTATLTNSTISGNLATTWGGGLHSKGVLNVSHCTVVNNRAKAECAAGQLEHRCPKGRGGDGVFVRDTLNVMNTIIAHNGRDDCVLGQPGEYGMLEGGKLGVNANNFFGDGSCEAMFSGDPMLASLADNGGATETHALRDGSPAIDALSGDQCYLPIDQRGLPRFDSTDGELRCDIGAFEVQP